MELSTKLSSLEKHGEPTPKMAIKELTRKAGSRILEAKKVDTKFDRKAVMLLVEVDSTKTAVTFLPVRFEKTLDDSDLQEMTSSKSCIRSVTMCCNEVMLAYTRELLRYANRVV
ncbi:hypothetical protein J6590_094935 [Homalodisca vitripennis]|nr:hypothetical protein J6590_094935 [Homalodisca vitripennis]